MQHVFFDIKHECNGDTSCPAVWVSRISYYELEQDTRQPTVNMGEALVR